MSKPFMTYDQQVQKLKDKHLLIDDQASAVNALHHIGYFTLISGYKDIFKNPSTKNYIDGTTFQDILAFYEFDESLRMLTLQHLLHIERHICSVLSYSFCVTFGDSQAAYITPQNYHNTPQNQAKIQKLIQRLLKPNLEHKTNYPYIEHHKRTHHNVPLWVLMNVLSFGTVSKMYTLSKPQIQSAVSQEFKSINERQLGQILQVLSDFRNVCAHGERLFSHRCQRHDIPDLLLHSRLSIPQRGAEYQYGKRDYFAVVLSFRYLLPRKEFLTYKIHLSRIIEKTIDSNRTISKTMLLQIMGMPANWEKISSFKKF